MLENSVLLIDVFYENTKDRDLIFSPHFIFINGIDNVTTLNSNFTTAYTIDKLSPFGNASDTIVIGYGGSPSDIYEANVWEFEANQSYSFNLLENVYDFCLQDAIDKSFSHNYRITADEASLLALDEENE
jgi:hypothetical protein